jgi:hypothetical protein
MAKADEFDGDGGRVFAAFLAALTAHRFFAA